MEKIRGYKFTIEIEDKIEGFALSILALINIKSSRTGVIHDLRTVEGTNLVVIVAYEDMEKYLSQYKIIDKEEIVILDVGYDNYDYELRKTIEELDEEYYDEKIGGFYIKNS